MSQFIGHSRSRRMDGLLQQQLLLPLLPHTHRSKVRQHLHHPNVVFVERLIPSMRHDKDRASSLSLIPRKQNPIGHFWRFNPQQIEETLRHAKQLRPPSLQTNSARARRTRKHRIQKIPSTPPQ